MSFDITKIKNGAHLSRKQVKKIKFYFKETWGYSYYHKILSKGPLISKFQFNFLQEYRHLPNGDSQELTEPEKTASLRRTTYWGWSFLPNNGAIF